MAMLQAILVFLGGGLGALGRYGFGVLSLRLWGQAWPWGTLGVNIIGGFAMGLLAGHFLKTGVTPSAHNGWWVFLGTGVLGGFTTFSAFSLETAEMLRAGQLGQAGLYTVVSLSVCVGAVLAGMALARLNG